MPATQASAPMRRELLVLRDTQTFTELMKDTFLGPQGVQCLSDFVEGIEERARNASREFSAFLKDHFKGNPRRRETELTRLADASRTILKCIAEMKEEVARLKKNENNTSLRLSAGSKMGFLRAYCEAFENLVL